jgi:stage II sporulation protein P
MRIPIQEVIMRMNRTADKMLIICFVFAMAAGWHIPEAYADDWFEAESGYYTLVDESGKELTMMAREILVNDEYISGDNKYYSVISADKGSRKAVAKYVRDVKLPEIEENIASIAVLAQEMDKDSNILLYSTHTDESYIPSDGSHTKPGKGGILDVAESFKNALQKRGINAVLDKTPHEPHDAAAYRRSRQTAINLMKKHSPVAAIFDIHRDAVPARVYATRVAGQPMTKVRIVVGSRNQNRQANEELAYKIKAVADKVYPGLIKDIFIGAGAYNQELSPRSLLFEFGTHENSKESAQRSAQYLAVVIDKAMFGGTVKGKTQEGEEKGTYRPEPIEQEDVRGGRKGLLWLFLVLVAGGGIFFFISGGGREMISKVTGTSESKDKDEKRK